MTHPFAALSQNGGNLLCKLGKGRSHAGLSEPTVTHHSITKFFDGFEFFECQKK